jgi:peptidoglycan/xylan/chitin deacetylase (PgdA/CDA1 family)
VHYVFLSHDVDWSFQGPGRDHILARRDRFDEETIMDIDNVNPYDNINDYISIEEKFGVRSTFFFRTKYENDKLIDYEDDIQTLLRGGWEIGLHSDPASIDNFDSMYQEKRELESITKKPIKANRTHYLAFSERLSIILNRLGFVYDSSVMVSKNRIDYTPPGYFLLDNVIEFPITIMDAYLFTYMHVTEDKIIDTFRYALGCARKYNGTINILTIVWHSNVLKMKGGRKYKEILEYLSCQKDVKLFNGIELSKIINANSEKYQRPIVYH